MAKVKAGLGFSVHTGWAVAVVCTRSKVLARARLTLYDSDYRFAYHAAVEHPAEAAKMIAETSRLALRNGAAELRKLLGELQPVVGVAAPKPLPALEAILKAHPLLHTAEGELYRRALEGACVVLGLEVRQVTPVAKLPDFGEVGRPWSKDHRTAAAFAIAAL
jgi:hypothetical protein